MLARDAENLYWLGRYLGRAENTARLIITTTDLLLDLPREASLGWGVLLQIAGMDRTYAEHYSDANETDIMNFLIADKRNLSSILSSLKFSRENSRTLRELLPDELWERVNNLYLYANDNLEYAAKNRRNKYIFLQNVISQRHSIVGLITTTMERDLAYQFIKLGTNIERADMTTRIMDINYAVSLPKDTPLHDVNTQLLWVGILKALSAFLAYRRIKSMDINMQDVVDFLFNESRFPRSVCNCLNELESALAMLPLNEPILDSVNAAKANLALLNTASFNNEDLHDFIDLSQQRLAEIHLNLTSLYFRPNQREAA
jgi:uncharacterized alpha-E superfamily protein